MAHANAAAKRSVAMMSSCALAFATALAIAAVLFMGGCTQEQAEQSADAGEELSLHAVAEAYVKLGLALGNHDRDYVDAYFGPPEWREEAERAKPSHSEIRSRSAELIHALDASLPSEAEEVTRLRHRALRKHLE